MENETRPCPSQDGAEKGLDSVEKAGTEAGEAPSATVADSSQIKTSPEHEKECVAVAGGDVSSVADKMAGASLGEDCLLNTVRESARAIMEQQEVVSFSEEALVAHVESMKDTRVSDIYKKCTRRVSYPLQFRNVNEEINFHCVLALLRSGAAFEQELTKLSRQSVEDCHKFGLIGLHISSVKLDAAFMCNITNGDIATNFNIPTHVDVPSEIPGVQMQKPGDLVPFVEDMKTTLHAAGARLQELGCPDFATFVRSVGNKDGVGGFVRALTKAFSGFNDCAAVPLPSVSLLEPLPLMMHKNAQCLAAELHHRMGGKVPELLFSDVESLTPYADADVVSCLINLDILVPKEGLSKPEAFHARHTDVLRAVSAQVVDVMAGRLGSGFVPLDLSLYLAQLSRGKSQKAKPRFAPVRSTML